MKKAIKMLFKRMRCMFVGHGPSSFMAGWDGDYYQIKDGKVIRDPTYRSKTICCSCGHVETEGKWDS